MHTCAQRGDDVRVIEIGGEDLVNTSEELGLERSTDGQSILELFAYIQEEMVRRAPIKKKHLDEKSSDEELFDYALENRRIDIFVGNMQTLIDELHNPESPAYNAQSLFDTLCERGKGYNIFLFGEVQDRDQEELLGYACIDCIRSGQSGIRFGGRFSEQKMFSFENIRYQDQERSMKVGVGVIPSEDNEAPLIRVVVPLA